MMVIRFKGRDMWPPAWNYFKGESGEWMFIKSKSTINFVFSIKSMPNMPSNPYGS
jgi:hypothetical protein